MRTRWSLLAGGGYSRLVGVADSLPVGVAYVLAVLMLILPLSLFSADAWGQNAPASAGGPPLPPSDDDSPALALPFDSAPSATTVRSTAVALEAEQTYSTLPVGGDIDAQRLSMDLRSNLRLASDWRVLFADRLDLLWPGTFDGAQHINTLKEAFVSWQARSDALFDLGRINVRQGVAFGYNPTDFLRADALRAVDSIDPDSLRQNRLGTAMLRAQQIWDSGSMTELYAPKLAEHASAAPFDPDLGATNNENRWMISLSQRLMGNWSPQWLMEGGASSPAQFGFNTTAALGDATVAYLELATGNSRSLWDQAQTSGAANSLHARASTGFTYSAPDKISVTLEYEYDGAALSGRAWSAARSGGNLEAYGRYRAFLTLQQEPPTQHNAFGLVSWQDALVRHLDLSAFVRVDLVDHSRLPWMELRYHWTHIDVALRWQDFIGDASSDYGASATRQSGQVLLDYYL